MAQALVPGLPTATAHNRHELLRGSPSDEFNLGCPVSAQHQSEARSEFAVKRAFAEAVGHLPVRETLIDIEASSWLELTAQTSNRIESLIDDCDLTAFSSAEPVTELTDEVRRAKDVATEGVSTISAFLQVISRLAPHTTDAEYARTARSSMGFVISWASMHGAYDKTFAGALAGISSNEQHVFRNLTFQDKWFEYRDGRVGLDPERFVPLQQSLRARLRRSGYSLQRTPAVVFGCPAAVLVPDMYRSMVANAEANELFTYKQGATR